ncbi:MAG TPA: DUF2189 domain-containing protein, partial [Rhodoferax sp.]
MSNDHDEVAPPPYVPPPPEAPASEIVAQPWFVPMRWLRLGWRDLRACPGISLFYGLTFWGMAVILGAVFRERPEFTMTIVSGCLLVGPFLAMGLYEASRRCELNLQPSFIASVTCWKSHLRSMGLLV